MMSLGVIGANRRRGAAAWTPASYFTGGVDGGYWDASDLSSLYQGTDTSTPVTTAGQSVGRWNDKSGNGYHLLQSGNKPTYQTGGGAGSSSPYIDFDGVNDYMQSAAFSSAKAQPHFIALACKLDTIADFKFLFDGQNLGRLALFTDTDTGTSYWRAFAGGSVINWGHTSSSSDVVLAASFNGASSVLYKDGSAGSTNNAGSNSWDGITLGASSSANANWDGRIYRMFWAPSTPDATTRANIVTWLGAGQGRSL